MWIDIRANSERESRPCGSLNHLHGIFISSRFPLAKHLVLPGSGSIFGLSQGPPMCACAPLSQDWILAKRLMGRLTSLPF